MACIMLQFQVNGGRGPDFGAEVLFFFFSSASSHGQWGGGIIWSDRENIFCITALFSLSPPPFLLVF